MPNSDPKSKKSKQMQLPSAPDFKRCAQELREQGYAVLEGFLTPDQLEELRMEADTLYELAQEASSSGSGGGAATWTGGTSDDGSSGGGGRWGRDAATSCIYESIPGHRCTPKLRTSHAAYCVHRSSWPLRPSVCSLLFKSQLTELVLALVGTEAVLFNDQYIIKPPESRLSAFQWHRDSDWCRSGEAAYSPYISVWCALDDMTTSNGCFVVERERGCRLERGGCQRAQQSSTSLGNPAAAEWQRHQHQGHEDGIQVPLEVPAGTAIVTTDTLWHCSGPNRSRHMRRAWMPQFSAAPLIWRASGTPVALAIPLVLPPQHSAAAAECHVMRV